MSEAKDAAKQVGAKAEQTASWLDDHPAMQVAARIGHVANGIVHLVLAGIAIAVALGAGGSADQSGALQAIASTGFGVALVWFVVVAMLGLAITAIIEGVAARKTEGWGELAKGVGKAVAYVAVAVSGMSVLFGGGSDGDQQAETWSARLMGAPFGVVLVGAVGLGILAVGAVFVVRGIRQSFMEHIAPPASARGFATALGTTGYVAKGIAIGVVGVLFLVAAFTHDPENAAGLDGALKALRELPFGQILLIAVGAGIGAYGVYSIARAAWPPR